MTDVTTLLKKRAAEKLRALLQSAERLKQRGWGASRVCRDYYDLWEIFRRESDLQPLHPVIDEKCRQRGISFEHPGQFFTESLVQTAFREWKNQILPFVLQSPSPQEVIETLKAKLLSVL